MNYFLAVDIGASSGRHILASVNDDRIMKLEEIYRFENGLIRQNGHLCWDFNKLFDEIIKGMKLCKKAGKAPVSMGIDTWGVDFVLLDKDNNVIGDTVGYRDERTTGMDEEVYKLISEEDLYSRTGIQKAMYNSIYQLMSIKKSNPDYLESASALLFTPDYFNFLLTGIMKNEYTISTTSQLINPETGKWDYELLKILGYPENIFQKIVLPGTLIGRTSKAVSSKVGFSCDVIAVASHDTASAVLAVPAIRKPNVYISSGTWSLMGVERMKADCSVNSMKHNMTNEGGYDYRYRYLKNIMGLWMIQSVKKESETELSYDEICKKASSLQISSIVNCYDDRFLAPASMTEEIKSYCRETSQQVPDNLFEVACVIYNSLAKCYADTINELEELTGEKYKCINVVGGGSNAVYLNKLTAEYTGRTVYAGPGEATAIGNIAVQMISKGIFSSVDSARTCIFKSFGVTEYPYNG